MRKIAKVNNPSARAPSGCQEEVITREFQLARKGEPSRAEPARFLCVTQHTCRIHARIYICPCACVAHTVAIVRALRVERDALWPRLDVFNKRSTCSTYWILPRHPHQDEVFTGVLPFSCYGPSRYCAEDGGCGSETRVRSKERERERAREGKEG